MAFLHWLRICLHDRANRVAVLPGEWGPPEAKMRYMQPMMRRHESGACVFFGSGVEEQPAVLEVPGEACERIEQDTLRRLAVDCGGWVSRLDLATDLRCEDPRGRIRECVDLFTDPEVREAAGLLTRIPASSCRVLFDHAPDGGMTAYFGSRSSEFMLRMYDRRDTGLRIELELKPAKRHKKILLARNLHKYGASRLFVTQSRALVFPFRWFLDLLQEEGEAFEEDEGPIAKKLYSLDAITRPVKEQYGVNLWLVQQAGRTIHEVAKRPVRQFSAHQHLRAMGILAEMKANGEDTTEFEAAIEPFRRKQCRP